MTQRASRALQSSTKRAKSSAFMSLSSAMSARTQRRISTRSPSKTLDQVPAIDGATEKTVAVLIQGSSLGSVFHGWLAYYDDVRRPVTPDLHRALCVVGLPDERILIKKLHPSQTPGLYDLLSAEDPIEGVRVEWAAKVKGHDAPVSAALPAKFHLRHGLVPGLRLSGWIGRRRRRPASFDCAGFAFGCSKSAAAGRRTDPEG